MAANSSGSRLYSNRSRLEYNRGERLRYGVDVAQANEDVSEVVETDAEEEALSEP